MLSISQIVKVTKKKTKERSALVKVIDVQTATVSEGKTYYFVNCKTKIDEYNCQVIAYTDKPITKNILGRQKVWVHCDCGDFKFRCEHALTEKGSSSRILTKDIEPGSGVTGLEANPRRIPWVCKHIIKVFANIPRIKVKDGDIPLKMAVKLGLDDVKDRIPGLFNEEPKSKKIPKTKKTPKLKKTPKIKKKKR
jgi:hypothetical protein